MDPGTTWPYIWLKTIYRLICFYGSGNYLSSLASAKVYPSYQVFMEISKLVHIYFLSRSSLIPVFVLVIYGRFINCIGLVTFPIATVFVVVFLVSLSCILIKLLGVRRYLISFLSHFTPAGVNVNTGTVWSACGSNSSFGLSWPTVENVSYSDYILEEMAPQALARLVCYLELLGYLIRPVSLSLRLVANISCRHILMVLASSCCGSMFHMFRIVLFVCALETLVCFVQCYVFYTLWYMYMKE